MLNWYDFPLGSCLSHVRRSMWTSWSDEILRSVPASWELRGNVLCRCFLVQPQILRCEFGSNARNTSETETKTENVSVFLMLCILCYSMFLWARHFIFTESKDWPLDRVIINSAVSSCEKGWQWETWLSLNVVLWEAMSGTVWMGWIVSFEARWGMVM